MSIGVIAVIWGLIVPICNLFYSAVIDNDKVREARREQITAHPIWATIGMIVGYAPVIAYWVFVITNLL